jgi:hypothetical protein
MSTAVDPDSLSALGVQVLEHRLRGALPSSGVNAVAFKLQTRGGIKWAALPEAQSSEQDLIRLLKKTPALHAKVLTEEDKARYAAVNAAKKLKSVKSK